MGPARAVLVDGRAVGRRAVRYEKARASRSYQVGSCGSYRMGGQLRLDALLGWTSGRWCKPPVNLKLEISHVFYVTWKTVCMFLLSAGDVQKC